MREQKYKEILLLYDYCKKIGVEAELSEFYDGYVIRFKTGGDFVQHAYSYGGSYGYVEPAICSKADYTAVSLANAKRLVKRHKNFLNAGGRQ